ncbi:T9SS type A sorting domain-containing protein [Chitinophaga sp. SYP-B3965]|uniref:discoidin domain-containing protein n=1 Tax=Chitinophaga sp. SYP-B3965 TaxID=2663120 RepID=UPI001299C0FF|nr:discoidin domain-containing protein [Chitinophaga sp. SYP-B3965]MRG48523.1 T9SS type A sorting domain-containing protein [Chitinophaga sp. SYP-B3965]
MMQAYFTRAVFSVKACLVGLLLFVTAAVQAQQSTVIADGPGNTYELMNEKGYNVESPDCGHAVKHINEIMDTQLGKYVFGFTLHRDLDDDRCGATDRQRIELRGTGSAQQGTQGSTSHYRWKFKLDANFQESPNFCHIMQLKAYGNGHGSGSPIITLTPRYNNKMEIGHTGLGGAVATADLSLFKGVWVEAYVKIKHDNNGTLEFVVKRLSDGVTLLSYTNNSLDMWEDGAGYGAPKFGFYRSLTSPSYLRDETIRLADICVTKGTTSLCPSDVGTACVPASASTDDGNVPGNVLDNNLSTRWSASGNPQWIQLCLSSTQTVSGVQIAFYQGTTRRSNFDIQVSTNGTSFSNVSTGLQSSGTSNALETFNFSPTSAKYVRIVGHGNTVNAWNSYTEVKVLNGSSFVSRKAATEEETNEIELKTTPNPFTQQTTVSFHLKAAGKTHLAVYDITGKVVAVLVNGQLPAGKHTIPFKCGDTPAGSYILQLQHGGRSISKKLQKL